jgi:hypothetical protein
MTLLMTLSADSAACCKLTYIIHIFGAATTCRMPSNWSLRKHLTS